MTLTGDAVVLTSVSLIVPVPFAAELLIPATAERLHVNVVPDVLLVGVYINAVPLVAVSVRLLDNSGIGL